MKSLLSTRFLVAAALALATAGAASVAQARTDVQFSIGVQAPGYYEPAPVYVQPSPVYVDPRPVYTPPPVYGTTEVYVQRAAPEYGYANGWDAERARRRAEWREWRRHEWQRHEWQRHEWQRRHDGRDWD